METVGKCLEVFVPMIQTMKPIRENMYNASRRGFINATDLADYLTKKGMPFRTAYKTVGTIVAECIKANTTLDEMPLDAYKKHSDVFDADLFQEISLETCVRKRISEGSTGYESVAHQIEYVGKFISANKK